MKLKDSIINLIGVGDKTENLLNKLDIFTNMDLINYMPHRYEFYQEALTISQSKYEDVVTIKCRMVKVVDNRKFKNIFVTKCQMSDGMDLMEVVFFNMPYIIETLRKECIINLRGIVDFEDNRYSMKQPTVFTQKQYEQIENSYQPVYELTKGVTSNLLRKLMRQVMPLLDEIEAMDFIKKTEGIIKMTKAQALLNIHFPSSKDSLIEARNYLVFEEFYNYFYQLQEFINNSSRIKNPHVIVRDNLVSRLIDSLPYKLTSAQERAWKDIGTDIGSDRVMNRLLQGDVGCGKTVLAYMSMIASVNNGYQAVLMVPTQVLANQHYEGLIELLEKSDIDIKVGLLVGATSAKDKKAIYEKASNGDLDIVIGTHALIQEEFKFKDLGMVIIDENHKFGVKQMETLSHKGNTPHLLSMSATPIPRTLSLVLYCDKDISTIDALPANRKAIKNCVVSAKSRNASYKFIKDEILKSRQAYVVCPMVDTSEDYEGLEDVVSYSKKISEYMGEGIKVEYLHGKMKANKKDDIMQRYLDGEIDVLVSTTVIEVGVNVPNATVIMIENAQQFGLASLHQLRGRVGRSDMQSYCIFVNTSNKSEANERLEVVNHSNDGFYIADKDLELRGGGDVIGVRQSGFAAFKIGNIFDDSYLLKEAKKLVANS